MLDTLSIRQFAIIERAEIHFRPGFTVLSGETGAGKSILIDALSLLMGNRADPGMIRHGAEKADLNARFSNLPKALSEQLDNDELIDEEAPDNCLIRRTLREKGGKVFINTHPLTSARLRTLSVCLLDIHGQHANQALVRSGEQRDRVDRFGKLGKLLATVADTYQHWQKQLQRARAWQEERTTSAERLELIRYQLDEFERIAPQENEFTTLAKAQQLLAASDEILAKGGQLKAWLHENEPSLSEQLHAAFETATALAALNPDFHEARDLLNQAGVHLDEASDSLSRALNRIEHDPARLAEIDARMSALYGLARKHRLDPQELHSKWQSLRAEHDAVQRKEKSGETLEAVSEAAHTAYNQSADSLTAARRTAGERLAEKVQQLVRQLGMARAIFTVEHLPAQRPSAKGRDEIRFLLCANPGQTPQPLAKVASGGELSRVSLAIEVAGLDEAALPETLIFDEIDAGIGGEIADTIGKLLQRLGRTRQVLCITHLPQVAVWADHHYTIEKITNEDSTRTCIERLAPKQRIIEIARMLGSANADTSREHARVMLEQAGNRQ